MSTYMERTCARLYIEQANTCRFDFLLLKSASEIKSGEPNKKYSEYESIRVTYTYVGWYTWDPYEELPYGVELK